MNYDLIKTEMQAEIDAPLRSYAPNSPGNFVRYRLYSAGHTEEAKFFWSCYCSRYFADEELMALYEKLQEIEKKEKFPDWGVGRI